MLFIFIIIAALVLTAVMFIAKNAMLGFPCLIFWALAGAHCYTQSAATWDMYYITFFASFGMAIFTAYAAFALRKRDLEPNNKDWLDSGKFLDEDGKKGSGESNFMSESKEQSGYIDDPSKPSRRTQELHDRAANRRTGGDAGGKKRRWGEFR
jgi:hypothetical protein